MYLQKATVPDPHADPPGPTGQPDPVPPEAEAPLRPPQEDDPLGVAEEIALGDEARTRAANEALRALARASRSYLIYDPRNEAIRTFLEDVKRTFEDYFLQHGDMPLEVRPFELVLDGEVVYLERDRERSLAFKLFRDGVRKLTLGRETTWDELTRLLEIVSIRFVGIRQNPAEDDVLTLLWKAGFAHISLEAIEGFVPEDDAVETGTASAFADGAAYDEGAGRFPPDFDLPLPDLPRAPPATYAYVPADELKALASEDTTATLPQTTVRLVEELLAAARDPTDPLRFADMAHLVREIRDFLLSEAQLDTLLALSDLLSAHAEQADEEEREQVLEVVASFSDRRVLGRILHTLPHHLDDPPEHLRTLVHRIGEDPTPVLLDLLAAERGLHARRMLRKLLLDFLPQRADALVQRFRTEQPGVAADILRVLVEGADESTRELVSGLVRGSPAEVQIEFLHLLEEREGTRSLRSVLVSLLHAPEAEVRIRTAQRMAELGGRGAYLPLERALARQAAAGASDRELRTLAEAMARVDPRRALQGFRERIHPKGLIKRFTPRARAERQAAIAGLALVPDPAAQELLEELAQARDQDTRQRAQQALVRRRRLLPGDGAKPAPEEP